MKYCKKCGAELAEGVSFCEKCGNPVGHVPKQKGGKKKWVLAISSGVILLAVGIVGGLFATGVIGGKDNVVETSTDTADIQEIPSVTGEAVGGIETLERDKQKDTSDNENTEDMAWEAFQAYKILINNKKDEWKEEVAEIWGEDESNTSHHCFELIYLDGDDYPELLIYESVVRPTGGVIYTYKGGETEEISSFVGGTISYQEKMGYIYSRGWYTCDWTEVMVFYNGDSDKMLFNNTISDSNYENNYYGVEKVAELAGIDNTRAWTTLDFSDSENGSDIVWGENIDEAYTQLLSWNEKKKESRDYATLDTVYSALLVAMANETPEAVGLVSDWTEVSTIVSGALKTQMEEQIGTLADWENSLVSDACKGKKFYVKTAKDASGKWMISVCIYDGSNPVKDSDGKAYELSSH